MFEGALQLQSPAADIPEVIRRQSNHALRRNVSACFLKFLIVHQNFSGSNERLRALARSGQPSIHKKLVDSDFHEIFRLGASRDSCSTKVAAPASVQSVEAALNESLTKLLRLFSTAFSTNILKTSACRMHQRADEAISRNKSRPEATGGSSIF